MASSSWLPFARLYQGHSLVAIVLSLLPSLLLPSGSGDHPSICGSRLHHFSFALHSQLPLLHELQRPRVSTFPFPFSCTPRLSRSPVLSLPRLQLFFIVYRRWMSGRRVFGWSMNSHPCYIYSILPSTLHFGNMNLSFLHFSPPKSEPHACLVSAFPSPRFRYFQI